MFLLVVMSKEILASLKTESNSFHNSNRSAAAPNIKGIIEKENGTIENKTFSKSEPMALSLAESIYEDLILRCLDKSQIRRYLKRASSQQKNRLMVANAYAQYHGDSGIYDFIEAKSVRLESFSVYTAFSLKRDLIRFTHGLYGVNDVPKDTPLDNMVKDMVSDVWNYDFSRYFKAIKDTQDYSFLTVCNNILLLQEKSPDVKYLARDFKDKLDRLEYMVKNINLDLSDKKHGGLYLLDGITELRFEK